MNEAPDTAPLHAPQVGLTAFVRHVRKNQDAFPEIFPEAAHLLEQIEDLFQRFRPALNASPEPTLVVLAVRCHAFFATAASAAMACSTTEVQPLLRAMLECAGYAAHLSTKPELRATWVARADITDTSARKAVQKEFRHSEVCKSIGIFSKDLGSAYCEMYDASIDLGAHPNVLGVMSSFAIHDTGNNLIVQHHILSAEPEKILHTSGLVSQAALLSIAILRHVFPTSPVTDMDLEGPKQQLEQIAKGLSARARSVADPIRDIPAREEKSAPRHRCGGRNSVESPGR